MPDVLKPVAIIQHPDNHVVGYVSAQLNAPTSEIWKIYSWTILGQIIEHG